MSPGRRTFDYSTNLLEEGCSRKFARNFSDWHYSLSKAD